MTTPGLPEIIDDAIETYARDRLFTALPGQITKVYEAEGRQFVDVKPCLSNLLPTDDEDLRASGQPFTVEEWPIVPHTPVAYPQGGGKDLKAPFFITFPLQAGNFVLLVCCQRSLDRWVEIARRETIASINPADVGTHVLDGAVAIPCGPAPRANLLSASCVSDSDMILGQDGGAVIRITGAGKVHLGSAAPAQYVALAGKVADELDRIKQDLTVLKAAVKAALGNVAGNGSTLASGFETATTTVPSAPSSVAASKVKAD